ncbi:MAG: serine hydrolase, partial [Alphaproteobacteria bacterium]
MRWPGRQLFRRAALVFLTAIGVVMASASSDPAEANRKYAAIVIDGKTGEVLFSRKADYRRYPASLTKVMTLYMLFDALESGKLQLSGKISVSRRCAGMPPSDLRMKPGEKIEVERAIKALIVRSANDVACAVGETLAGTESKFAVKMTKKARAIGMKRTKFRNASGLYHRGQVTTARDMATLGLRIQKDFPQYYKYFKSLKVSWKGRTWNTHNRLMKYFPGADGLKTGYIRASGFNLITSARRGNMHLVGVVMGGRKSRSRNRHMVSILERNFARLLKRDEYVYPIADRLPELRPKPNFAAIESREWLKKKVGVIPRPNPFQILPDADDSEPAEVAVAQAGPPAPVSGGGTGTSEAGDEQAETAETKAAEDTEEKAQTASAATASAGKEEADRGKPEETHRRAVQSALPVLAASGAGTFPAGGGNPAGEELPETQGTEQPVSSAAPAGEEARQPESRTASARAQRPAQTPDGSTGDSMTQLIEEGDGQVAGDDMAGQVPARPDDGGDAAEGAVQIAGAAPGTSHVGASLLTPSRQWGVQLGAFTTVELAEIHLDNAERLQPDVLTREKSALVPGDEGSGALYRARFGP